MKIMSTFRGWDLNDAWVLVRADLNVPLNNGSIVDDTRLKKLDPTLQALIKKNARIILLTHIGRPLKPDHTLSTRILVSWLKRHGYSVDHAEDIHVLRTLQMDAACRFIMFENLRFFSFEKSSDPRALQDLASCASYFITDAFGTLHRTDASIVALPLYFDHNHRSVGILIEQELGMLQPFKDNPQTPLLLIMGGAKLETKLPLIQSMIGRATDIALLPALSSAMASAQRKNVGESWIEHNDIPRCRDLLAAFEKSSTRLILPVDYLAQDQTGTLQVVSDFNTHTSYSAVSIGPKSEKILIERINTSATIIMNGISGFHQKPETLHPMCRIFAAIGKSSATSLVAGGDTIAALIECKATGITHISTGGGATLSYLAGQMLPGLLPFINYP